MDPSSIYEELSQNKSQGQYKSHESNPPEKPQLVKTQTLKQTKSMDNTRSNNTKNNEKMRFAGSNGENPNEKEIKQKIENFKMQQNHEMLVILEEEQENEANREETMKKISDPKEKKRLEKIFGMERAKAQARIQELSE